MTTWRELCRELINSRGADYYRTLERARKALADEPAVPECHYPAPVPVPVAERLPGPEDCDEEGRCWLWRTDGSDEFWELVVPLSNIHEFNLTAQWKYTHWLPAIALPLPQGEVES